LEYNIVKDYLGPQVIYLHETHIWGLSCLHARDLLVQEYDSNGDLWATRGMVAYRLKKGDNKFIRQYHIPTGL